MDKVDQIALAMIPGLGPTACRRLLDLYPGENIFALPANELTRALGGRREVLHAVLNKTTHHQAEEELKRIAQHGIRALFCTDEDYPSRLNSEDTLDCPVLIYVMGTADLNAERTVALVGSRKATPHGQDDCRRLVEGLAGVHPTIVSGLAYGIDTQAHTASLEQHLPTIAVLGHGLDTIYPSQNRQLAARIVDEGGALLTEYPFGTAINPNYFPARNRIIAALSDATVVVEAAAKGGALITATIALGYHREVYAVPGRISDKYSEGTNSLIANNQASLIRGANDLIEQMGWPQEGGNEDNGQQKLFDVLPPEEQRIVDMLREQGDMAMDTIVQQLRMPMPQVVSLLFHLEMQRHIRLLPGRIYHLVER